MDDDTLRTPQQLGAVLQGYRKTQQLTQAQVGARVGLPQEEISKLEMNATTNQPDANPPVLHIRVAMLAPRRFVAYACPRRETAVHQR